MSISRLVAATLLPAALATPAPAQTAPELIGLNRATPASVVRQDLQTCGIARCPTLLTAAAAPFEGGTAYDATRSAVWVSNGPVVQAVDPSSCRVACAPHQLPSLGGNVRVTGLAINEDQGLLVVAGSDNRISQYRLACPVTTLVTRCDATGTIPSGHRIGGIATDDLNDWVIYSSSDFASTLTPGNVLHVSRRSDPCNPICRINVPTCGGQRLGPITGVAFDPCTRIAWATDGNLTVGLRLSNAAVCQVQEVQCCSMPLAGGYVGLCVKPSQPTAVGQSCTNLGCPSCPTMAHTTTGDPALGNPSFSLDLVNAPARARGALWLTAGPCNSPGLTIFPFCGPILLPLGRPLIAINTPTGGTTGCTGGFKLPVPIPLDRSLCGGTISSQYLGICTAGPVLGTFVSNCLTWTITGT